MGEANCETADELSFVWLTPKVAAEAALDRQTITERLRQGHGLLSYSAYVEALAKGQIEIVLLPNACAALCAFANTADGYTLNVLTITGTLETAAQAICALEEAAKQLRVDAIISIGHPGWKPTVEALGYTAIPRLFMKKVLS